MGGLTYIFIFILYYVYKYNKEINMKKESYTQLIHIMWIDLCKVDIFFYAKIKGFYLTY